MKQSNVAITYKSVILFFLLTLLFVFGAQSQNMDTQAPDSTEVVKNAISIGDISDETEKLSQRIIKLKKILKPSAAIIEVDSLLKIASNEAKNKKDTLISQLNGMTRRVLKVRKVEWDNYRTRLKGYQNLLKDRTEKVSDITDELLKEIKRWEQTKKNITSNSESSDIYDGLDQVILTLEDIMKLAQTRLDSIYIIQNGLTELVLTVDETISEIEHVELQMQKDYFVFDSKPIWKSENIRTGTIDSTKTESVGAVQLIVSGLKENKKQLQEFLSLNIKTSIFQVIFILLLFVLMISVNKKWKKNIDDLINPVEIQAKIVLSHPFSSTVVAGVLISAFFYDALIPVFIELHILLILIATIFLLPKLTTKRFSLFLFLMFIVYVIQIFEAYLGPKSDMVRWLMIIDAIILIFALVEGRKLMKTSPEHFVSIHQIFKALAPFYILILVIAILANIIGMVSLSGLLISGIVTSTILGMVVYLTVKVITSLVVLFFKLRKSYSMQALTTMANATHQRIQPILNWIGFLVWLMFTLNGFDIFDFFVTWVNDLMAINWQIGEMTISLGGILAFAGIFIVSLILAKLVANIFLDNWMINVLPRGVAPAISLLMRIVLITIGLYMALSAAGIDLSSLGFMLGALGVGIGFGLQNVVLNFVAGLILAFERPINLGDTIQVDQEFGVVTNIGVRSSSIKSYSGYEAIIPNGDLISKKVINYTLTNRDRRSKIYMKTAPSADPEKVIELFNEMATENPSTLKDPAPKTYFYGYDEDGNLSFALLYWTTFSDTLKTDSAIALKIFAKLKKEGIQAPAPVRRIVGDK
jgi:potassium-dependent mechanosensitive channel